MGKQSSRIYFGVGDHKEIYFDGHYHDKMYLGSELVWEKLKQVSPFEWKTWHWSDWGHGSEISYNQIQDEWVGYANGLPTVVSWFQASNAPNVRPFGKCAVFSCGENGTLVRKMITAEIDHESAYFEHDRSVGSPLILETKVYRNGVGWWITSSHVIGNAYDKSLFLRYYNHGYHYSATIANMILGWHVYMHEGKSYVAGLVYRPDSGTEFGYYEETIITIDGKLSSVTAEILRYYSDEHGTVLECNGSLYFTLNGTDWRSISSNEPNFCHKRVTYFSGKYIIVSPSDGAIDSNGKRYEMPGITDVEYVFSKGNFLYVSCGNGMLYKTLDLVDFKSMYIGRPVFGSCSNTFLSTTQLGIVLGEVPICDTATIDF